MVKIKMLRSTKISWKITITFALLFAVVLVALNAIIYAGIKYYVVNQATQRVEEVSNATAEKILNDEHASLSDIEIIFDATQDKFVNIKIADPSGAIVNASSNFTTSNQIKGEDTNVHAEKVDRLVKRFSVRSGNEVKAYVQVEYNMEDSDEFLEILFGLMFLAGIFGVSFSLFAGWMVSRKMLRPIQKMTGIASKTGFSDLSNRIDVPPADDEMSMLAKTFNEMLDRIQDAFEKQGQFVADASHELRTPLAIIQGYVGMIDRWGKHDASILQEAIDAIKNETSSMTFMMERLLFLARGDNGTQLIEKETFEVSELIGELEIETRILAPDYILSFQCTQTFNLFADRKLIKQMLRALLDNSIKYTLSDGTIALLCKAQDNLAVFSVIDTGIGIPEEDQAHIFERFYRVDKARERKTGGSGLGLSIVKWIAEVHKGEIHLESKLGEGTAVTVTLPMSDRH